MPSFRTARVTEILAERPGLQRVRVEIERPPDDEPVVGDLAYALTDLVGGAEVGDRVIVNTTAVELGLGTGGWHVVHWNLERASFHRAGPGHVMKMRYTSLQIDTGSAEEHDPDGPTALDGAPVVACSLHSQVPVVAVAARARRPGTRVAYVMTDGASLPLALSDLVVAMLDVGLIVGTVTAGHAFGGDLEAVTVPSAIALATHRLAADVVVVAMGPGVAGTGSRLGVSALEQASILDATSWLGGDAIACVRASDGDARPRHQGVSHHTLTVLDATRSSVQVPIPPGLDLVGLPARHDVVEVDPPAVAELLADAELRVTTMGRGPDADPLFFAAAGAAGAHAAARLDR